MREFETMKELKLECLVDPPVELEMVMVGDSCLLYEDERWVKVNYLLPHFIRERNSEECTKAVWRPPKF